MAGKKDNPKFDTCFFERYAKLTLETILGAKYYPIPYRWGRLAGIFVIMGVVYGISLLIDHIFFQNAIGGHLLAKLGAHTILISGYLFGAWKLIRK